MIEFTILYTQKINNLFDHSHRAKKNCDILYQHGKSKQFISAITSSTNFSQHQKKSEKV